MSDQSHWNRKQFGPFAALLAAQVLYITLAPIVEETSLGESSIRLCLSGVLIAGLSVARESARFMTVAIVLLIVNLFMLWQGDFISSDSATRHLIRSALAVAYLGYLILALIRTLTHQREATLDTVLGGINVYLLLALMFTQLHFFAETLQPGSYLRGGLPLSDPANTALGSLATTLFYFSFTTLTTLGYGDIAPTRPFAQFLCSSESVIGQLFVAIFIGGLVALRVGNAQRNEPAKD